MARRGPMHEVHLVDDDPGDDGVTAAPGPEPATPGTRSRRRTPLAIGAALVTVLVAAGVTDQVVTARQERAQIAAVAAAPGGIDLLDGPPTARWELPGSPYDVAEVHTEDGLLVAVRDATQGPVQVVALDAATGDEAWVVDLIDGTTRPDLGNAQTSPWSGECSAHGTRKDLVVCLVHDGARVYGPEQAAAEPSAVRLVVLDTADGRVVEDLTEAVGGLRSTASFAAVGEVVVVAATAEGKATEVVALASDGAPAWRTTVPPAADEQPADTFVIPFGDLVALATPTEVRLLDTDGRVVRTVALQGRYLTGWNDTLFVYPRAEQSARGRDVDAVETRDRTTVIRPEGDVDVLGLPAGVVVDDGSVPGLLLMPVGNQLTAWDGDGEQLWSTEAEELTGAIVLGGRVHVGGGKGVITLDARTGDELWRSDAATTMPVTDGRHLLAVAASARRGEETEMVALDPADGSEMWRAPLPDSTDDLTTVADLLVAVDLFATTSNDGLGERFTVLR